MWYAKYSRAFQSGGWNADFRLNGLNKLDFEDETVDNYEAGLKSTLLDDSLRLNASVFKALYTDYQIFQFVPSEGNVSTPELTNAGEVENTGIEIEASWLVNDDLELTANVTLLDPIYTKFENTTFDPEGNPIVSSFSGNLLAYAPKTKFYLAARYYQETSLGLVSYHVDYSSVSDTYSDPANTEDQLIEGYGLINGRISIESEDDTWGASIYVNNATDEVYVVDARLNPFNFHAGTYGQPTTYGMSVRYKWF